MSRLVFGRLRISAKCYTNAYVSDPDGGADIFIEGLKARKTALDGDVVSVNVNEEDKTGSVSQILQKKHTRITGGFIAPFSNSHALFKPIDHRVPRMLISIEECPVDFNSSVKRYAETLFVAKISSWEPKNRFAHGSLIEIVGDKNTIQAKSQAMLLEYQIDDNDFPPDVYSSLAHLERLPSSWIEKEAQTRRDFRNECVFTIDPKTARDLDDAVSIKKINNDLFEVGVHIADVSYFVKESDPVDYHARLRTTSVYLVDRVVHMLPRILCETMCSLNPNESKLAFSVIWTLDKFGQIKSQWFGRTVIKSCLKLSYEQAQDLLSSDNNNLSWIEEDINMPPIHGKYSWKNIHEALMNLNMIAKNLRKVRRDKGALNIDGVKLKFELDPTTGLPTGFSVDSRCESKNLIEEFMLLANISVAKKIYKFDDKLAFLRCHKQPCEKQMKELVEFCKALGYSFDFKDSESLSKSLLMIKDPALHRVVSLLVLKSFEQAQYVCAGAAINLHHYALNEPLYTHFTSPIRRYPDIIVHRLLARSLGYTDDSFEDVQSLTDMSSLCNTNKEKAKNVSEGSAKIYFGVFLQKAGYCELLGCVTKVLDHSVDVVLVEYQRSVRVYFDFLSSYISSLKFDTDNNGTGCLRVVWHPADRPITINKKSRKDRNKRARENKERVYNLNLKQRLEDERNNTDFEHCHDSSTKDDSLTDSENAKYKESCIKILSLVKVYVTADKSNIAELKAYFKTPVAEFNQDLLIRIC